MPGRETLARQQQQYTGRVRTTEVRNLPFCSISSTQDRAQVNTSKQLTYMGTATFCGLFLSNPTLRLGPQCSITERCGIFKMELRQRGATLIQVLVSSEDSQLSLKHVMESLCSFPHTTLSCTISLPPRDLQKMTRCQHRSLGLSELKAQTNLLGIHSLLCFARAVGSRLRSWGGLVCATCPVTRWPWEIFEGLTAELEILKVSSAMYRQTGVF